jgi:hypothetical protein
MGSKRNIGRLRCEYLVRHGFDFAVASIEALRLQLCFDGTGFHTYLRPESATLGCQLVRHFLLVGCPILALVVKTFDRAFAISPVVKTVCVLPPVVIRRHFVATADAERRFVVLAGLPQFVVVTEGSHELLESPHVRVLSHQVVIQLYNRGIGLQLSLIYASLYELVNQHIG